MKIHPLELKLIKPIDGMKDSHVSPKFTLHIGEIHVVLGFCQHKLTFIITNARSQVHAISLSREQRINVALVSPNCRVFSKHSLHTQLSFV
jgi:hypothetical protein